MSSFFVEIKEQSEVKSQIVSDYFSAWANIMASKSRSEKLAYIDLFAGPGRYEDGTKSTPIKVLGAIISNPRLSKRFVTIFNDINTDYANNLNSEIYHLDGIASLQHKPVVMNSAIGDEIATYLKQTHLVSTLSFVDPWGYKGLSSKLVSALIKDWGSDCIFFFNYNRINMGINNPLVKEHMDSIFGPDRAERLREIVSSMSPQEREVTILNELAEHLSQNRRNYVLPFRFIRADGTRTSHYLILVSKHVLGYTLMKEIMYRYSSDHHDGVASFSYIPVEIHQLSFLFLLSSPLEQLGQQLRQDFAGKTIAVVDLFNMHHVGRPFVIRNYKETLRRLESEGVITCDPPANQRKKSNGILSLGDKVKVTFLN